MTEAGAAGGRSRAQVAAGAAVVVVGGRIDALRAAADLAGGRAGRAVAAHADLIGGAAVAARAAMQAVGRQIGDARVRTLRRVGGAGAGAGGTTGAGPAIGGAGS